MHLASTLPKGFPAAIFVVVHIPADSPSLLPQILSRAGKLKAIHPLDGDEIRPGVIYAGRPDYHLVVKPGHVVLAHGPRENGHRPAVDALFRTAARAYGPRVIGVILSGNLDDGTAGLFNIKQAGGTAVAQDPEEALYRGMPASAVENVDVDHIVRSSDLPDLLQRLVGEDIPGADAMSSKEQDEPDPAELGRPGLSNPHLPGPPSGFTCPECGGALWGLHNGELLRFKCHVGHSYSPNSLFDHKSELLEMAIWTALRALEEKVALAQQLADRSEKGGRRRMQERFNQLAQDAQEKADLVRRLLLTGRDTNPDETVEDA